MVHTKVGSQPTRLVFNCLLTWDGLGAWPWRFRRMPRRLSRVGNIRDKPVPHLATHTAQMTVFGFLSPQTQQIADYT